MAEAVTISVEARDPAKNKGTGSRVSRRLRAKGKIPAIIYGHKVAAQTITISRDDVWKMVKNSTHLAQLKIGESTEMVLVRDVQWDHLGKEIIHLDFARVSADETITTEVKLELHGTAPGVAEGGVLDFVIHTLEVKCRANAIPDTIRIIIDDLHLNSAIHVRDLKLPEGVTTDAEADLTIVHVTTPRAATEVTAEGAEQPEMIGRKPEDKEKEEKK
jgi:large subunit ribosomal protein L25